MLNTYTTWLNVYVLVHVATSLQYWLAGRRAGEAFRSFCAAELPDGATHKGRLHLSIEAAHLEAERRGPEWRVESTRGLVTRPTKQTGDCTMLETDDCHCRDCDVFAHTPNNFPLLNEGNYRDDAESMRPFDCDGCGTPTLGHGHETLILCDGCQSKSRIIE